MTNWNNLTDPAEISSIKEKSFDKPQVVFKHSTRCSISSVALKRLEKAAEMTSADFHFVDLIRFREVSNKISEEFRVYHESPQILLIKDGKCVYEESHLGINIRDLTEQIFSLN